MEPRISEFLERSLGVGWLAPNYPLVFAVATVLGLYLAVTQAKRTALDPYAVFKTGVVTIVAAFVSARLFVALEKFGYYSQNPIEIFYYWQDGLASSGAYLGGLLAAIIFSRRSGLQPLKFLDCAAPSVGVALCLGRIGCFLNGCCYGKPSNVPWAVSFPTNSQPAYEQLLHGTINPGQASVPLHPVQLYEAVFGFALFLFLLKFRKRQRSDGESIALLFLMYSGARFFFEMLRGDDRWIVDGISVPQYLSVLAVALSASFLIATRRRNSKQKPIPVSA